MARISRPDILYAVMELAQHCSNPGKEHVAALKRVIRYLKATRELGLTLRQGNGVTLDMFKVQADANFAGEPDVSSRPYSWPVDT